MKFFLFTLVVIVTVSSECPRPQEPLFVKLKPGFSCKGNDIGLLKKLTSSEFGVADAVCADCAIRNSQKNTWTWFSKSKDGVSSFYDKDMKIIDSLHIKLSGTVKSKIFVSKNKSLPLVAESLVLESYLSQNNDTKNSNDVKNCPRPLKNLKIKPDAGFKCKD